MWCRDVSVILSGIDEPVDAMTDFEQKCFSVNIHRLFTQYYKDNIQTERI